MRATNNEVVRLRLIGGVATQDEAAEKLGVSRFTMANIEGANQYPSAELRQRMAALYGCPDAVLERALISRRADKLRLMLSDFEDRLRAIDVELMTNGKNDVDKPAGAC